MVGWCSLLVDFYKLNVDGAFEVRKWQGSCGGLIRNDAGEFLGGFSMNIGSCSVLEAELWGIYYGLDMAWKTRIRKLVLESDSLHAINLVRQEIA